MSCPAAEIHLNTFHFFSSPMWSRKDRKFNDPASTFQSWQTSGSCYIKKKSLWDQKSFKYIELLECLKLLYYPTNPENDVSWSHLFHQPPGFIVKLDVHYFCLFSCQCLFSPQHLLCLTSIFKSLSHTLLKHRHIKNHLSNNGFNISRLSPRHFNTLIWEKAQWPLCGISDLQSWAKVSSLDLLPIPPLHPQICAP